jgi:signal transduction histidine kinase
VLGREIADVIVPPDLRDRIREGIRAASEDGDESFLRRRFEMRGLRNNDGGEFPAELTITRLPTKGPAAFACHVRDITERRRLIDELRDSRARIVQAADAERRRVERDLHDGAQQRLLAVAMDLRLAADQLEAGEDGARETLAIAAEELDRATAELRELARGLHPAILTERGLEVAIAGLVRRASLPVEVSVAVDERPPPAIEAAAYYVVSEALTNVDKYAHASLVHVDIYASDSAVELAIRDDGIGGADPSRGSGLVGLRDRVEALGGTIAIAGAVGEGTSVVARIPI